MSSRPTWAIILPQDKTTITKRDAFKDRGGLNKALSYIPVNITYVTKRSSPQKDSV